jgi:hypothetical protein
MIALSIAAIQPDCNSVTTRLLILIFRSASHSHPIDSKSASASLLKKNSKNSNTVSKRTPLHRRAQDKIKSNHHNRSNLIGAGFSRVVQLHFNPRQNAQLSLEVVLLLLHATFGFN